MNVNYKMMGVVLCGAMLLASGCGAKAETTASSAVESESVSVVALEAASLEAVPESEAVSEAVSEASSAVSEAASEKPQNPRRNPRKNPRPRPRQNLSLQSRRRLLPPKKK